MSNDEAAESSSALLALERSGARIVSPVLARRLLGELARLHVTDSSSLYWWSSLRNKPVVFGYGDDTAQWRSVLNALVQGFESEELLVAVTDDSDGAWPVVTMPKHSLVEIISDLPFFEYFVFEQDCRRVVFDTHHNSLVESCAGIASIGAH